MKKIFLSFILIASLSSFTFLELDNKVKVFIAGDSTAQTNSPESGLTRGWGQYLSEFLTDSVEVLNQAIGGRSTSSFIREGRWKKLISEVGPGDWVLIQFGHNDTSTGNPNRYTPPTDYKKNLMDFCAEVKIKGAIPVILTPIVFRTFNDDGKLVSIRPHFAEYIQLARDAAKESGSYLIDMNKLTHDFVQELGDEKSKEYYCWVKAGSHPKITEDKEDNTHLQEKGARSFAEIVSKGMKDRIPAFRKYVK